MENLICNAYAYIEYQGSYAIYRRADNESRSLEQLKQDWATIEDAYNKVSEYMPDKAIAQAQQLVMELL